MLERVSIETGAWCQKDWDSWFKPLSSSTTYVRITEAHRGERPHEFPVIGAEEGRCLASTSCTTGERGGHRECHGEGGGRQAAATRSQELSELCCFLAWLCSRSLSWAHVPERLGGWAGRPRRRGAWGIRCWELLGPYSSPPAPGALAWSVCSVQWPNVLQPV